MGYKNFTEIASFSFPIEANIAKASLESADIPAFQTNKNVINMQWLYSHAMGGVKLFVPLELEAEGRTILSADFSDHLATDGNESKRICSNCGSDNMEVYTRGKRPAFLVFLFLGFHFSFISMASNIKNVENSIKFNATILGNKFMGCGLILGNI